MELMIINKSGYIGNSTQKKNEVNTMLTDNRTNLKKDNSQIENIKMMLVSPNNNNAVQNNGKVPILLPIGFNH